jgi:hypothetical protein
MKDTLTHSKVKVYLCGPINGCTDAGCKDWREASKMHYPQSIDPMARDYRGREDECFKEIVELDKLDVLLADVILVNYDRPSVGASMEILFAWQSHKPVVIVADREARISPWLRYHSTVILHSFKEAFEWVGLYAYDKNLC